MKLAWDPEVDTPATIAVIGGGPLGVEAALYARFLGYFVMLFDRHKVGDSLVGWNQELFWNANSNTLSQTMPPSGSLEPTWRDCTTPLGLAALEAQSGSAVLLQSEKPCNYRDYVEQYLLPVARTDLLYESIQVHAPVRSISRVGCSLMATCSLDRRSEQEFRLLVDSKNRGEYSQLADIVLDCSGSRHARCGLATGGGLAVGETQHANQMFVGKRDILGKHRSKFAGKHSLMFGGHFEACANALELLQLAQEVPTTKLTWIIPKRIGSKGFQLGGSLAPAYEPPATMQNLIQRAHQAIDSELTHLIPLAAWGIESLSYDESTWSVKLQSTEEETLDLNANLFINCADTRIDQAYQRELLVHSDNSIETLPATTMTGEPHYYQLGQRAIGDARLCTLQEGFQQIRETFAWIGGRQGLDLYATVKPRGQGEEA